MELANGRQTRKRQLYHHAWSHLCKYIFLTVIQKSVDEYQWVRIRLAKLVYKFYVGIMFTSIKFQQNANSSTFIFEFCKCNIIFIVSLKNLKNVRCQTQS